MQQPVASSTALQALAAEARPGTHLEQLGAALLLGQGRCTLQHQQQAEDERVAAGGSGGGGTAAPCRWRPPAQLLEQALGLCQEARQGGRQVGSLHRQGGRADEL